MSQVPVVTDFPAALAVLREQLDATAAQYRVVTAQLADARTRERKLLVLLNEAQRALAEVADLFTDHGIGELWSRTPYVPAENVVGYRRTAAQKLPLPGS